jgi:hypothetical protein
MRVPKGIHLTVGFFLVIGVGIPLVLSLIGCLRRLGL